MSDSRHLREKKTAQTGKNEMTESAEKNFPAYSHLPKYSPEGLKHDGNQETS